MQTFTHCHSFPITKRVYCVYLVYVEMFLLLNFVLKKYDKVMFFVKETLLSSMSELTELIFADQKFIYRTYK